MSYTIRQLHWDKCDATGNLECDTVGGSLVVFALVGGGYELDFSSSKGFKDDKNLGKFDTSEEAEQSAFEFHVKQLERLWLVKHITV